MKVYREQRLRNTGNNVRRRRKRKEEKGKGHRSRRRRVLSACCVWSRFPDYQNRLPTVMHSSIRFHRLPQTDGSGDRLRRFYRAGSVLRRFSVSLYNPSQM
ncbi:hypothetical protein TIFTF001_017357 [Ficus carica]|uniref:Uncharacterized protein n=1 Tax=Ficus carica TaxID=3494 RepID=A0AA88A928_FICCA|nr:hypothetical protein TIFTF001_017357 [Ficus carica]